MSAFAPVIVHSDDGSVVVWDFAEGRNHIRLLLGADETAGRLSFFESVLARGQSVSAHTHANEDEYWYFVDDGMEVALDGTPVAARANTLVAIPAGTLHAVRNPTSAPIRSVFFTTPGGLEAFFAGLAELVAAGGGTAEERARLFESTGTSFPRRG